MKEVEELCSSFGVTLGDAEQKLKDVAGSDYTYFTTKNGKGQAMESLWFTIVSLSTKGEGIKNILEIGTGKAEKTEILSKLFPGANVITFDLPEMDKEFELLALRKNDKYFLERINRENVTFIPQNSFFLLQHDLPMFDFIWLDGGHNYPAVAWDLFYSYHKLNKDGFLFMHDYKRHGTDVQDVVDGVATLIPESLNFLPFAKYDPSSKVVWLIKE